MVNEPDACHGPCQQGRIPCPHPEACHRPEEEPNFYGREHWLDIVESVVVIAIVAGGLIMGGVLITRWLA